MEKDYNLIGQAFLGFLAAKYPIHKQERPRIPENFQKELFGINNISKNKSNG